LTFVLDSCVAAFAVAVRFSGANVLDFDCDITSASFLTSLKAS